jgi:hypothetical protein
MDACERHNTTLDNPGFCIACGEEVEGVEPDARRYTCEFCSEDKVYGAEELLLTIMWGNNVLPMEHRIMTREEKIAAASAKYDKVRDSAGDEFEKVHDLAYVKYQKVFDSVLEYIKVCDAAWAEYTKVETEAKDD